MYQRIAPLAVVALAACQMMGGLTVKDYTARSGARVMAGQAEPKAEYRCAKLAQERQAWGIKGNMDKVGAMERVTAAAVDAAPAKGANYAYIMAPSEIGIGAVNVNAFSDAQVAYYKCGSLPAAK
ncbi:MAG: hypothetical protein ABR570_00575 [Burkholderiales bacterium]